MADTVYCNGTDLSTLLTPIGLIKMFGLPPGVGQDYVLPGYVGALPAQLGRGPRTVTVGGLIVGPDLNVSTMQPAPYDVEDARAAYHNKLADFASVVYQDGDPFTLVWEIGNSAGIVQRTALARYLTGIDEIEQLTPWAGRVAVDFLLLQPNWS